MSCGRVRRHDELTDAPFLDEIKLQRNNKKNRQAIKEMIVKDAGGPTRAFLSEAWGQLENLQVARKDANGNIKKAKLWHRSGRCGLLFPAEDERIMGELGLCVAEDSPLYAQHYQEAKKICRPVARAVGRLIFYCMANILEEEGSKQYFHGKSQNPYSVESDSHLLISLYPCNSG